MVRLIATRVVIGLLTLLAVCILLFLLISNLGYDAASAVLGQGATPDALVVYRHELGLDRPTYMRLFEWIWNLFHGSLGVSLTNQRDVLTTLTPRLDRTLFLAGFAALIAVPVAVGLGILAAINEGRWPDKLANILSLATISVPEFFVGYLLILLMSQYLSNYVSQFQWVTDTFGENFKLFTSDAIYSSDMPLLERLHNVTLPAVALTMLVTAHILRTTRSALLSVMSQPYIEMAFLKGLSRARVILVHALPNAAAPIISVIALNLAYLIVGVVVIETVFNYHGLGEFMVDGVSKADAPVVLGCALVFATAFISLNTLADVLAILVNPRLRHPR
jgi:peptide/nickel transport system permease protein